MKNRISLLAFLTVFLPMTPYVPTAVSEERLFTYLYDAEVMPEGEAEFEQWVTNQNGKEDGDYSQWNFRTEFEYGFTERYTSSLYLNFDSTRSDGVTGIDDKNNAKFKSVSWEHVYQILNPNLDPIGMSAYVELGTDGIDHEVESKLLLSKPIGKWNLAFNAVYETEFERDDGKQEKEAKMQFLAGASYKLSPKWAVGIEARNKTAYPDGLNLSGQEYNAWSVGPNVHYGNPKWWATLTILPQVWGNGDGSRGGRQLVHEEAVEVRFIVGIPL